MKKFIMSILVMYSSLFADINGEPEQIMINKFKKELNIPYRIDKVSSMVEVYLSFEKTGKNIVIMYVIDNDSKFDKEKLKQAYYKDFKNMVCNSSVNIFFGDDKKNTISYRIMSQGKYLFEFSYVNEDCNK